MNIFFKKYCIVIFLCILPIQIFAQSILNDDFKNAEKHWYWRADGNQSIPIVENGLLKLKLQNAIDSEYCNTEIYNPTEPYAPGTELRIRLKASKIHQGSRGWGFWDGDLQISSLNDFDVAWVMQQGSKKNSPNYNWFQFGVGGKHHNNLSYINLHNILNENTWHTYKIVWANDKVTFSVDDVLLFTSTKNLPDQKMRVDIWIDNRVLNRHNPLDLWNNNTSNSEMFVDFVEVSGLDGPSIERQIKDDIILWDSPNSYPNGYNNYKWKEYNFTTNPSGETLVFVTGSAEYYGDILTEDELKIKIDEQDFGWKNNFALDGKALKGSGSSITKTLNLSSGKHKLELFSNQTPFLRDVIVVNSPNGKVIYNKQYNNTAPNNNGLWKEIQLNSQENTDATIIVSGTANIDENLTFELNDINFDEYNDFSINGNILKDKPNTIITNVTLKKGMNYFKIFNKGNAELYNVTIYGNDFITNINSKTKLEQNISLNITPNPFNNSTVIKYNTIKISQNKVTIFNTLGQKIETLVNSYQAVGEHSVYWNANNVPSGIYFCVLESNNSFQVKKLVLLK